MSLWIGLGLNMAHTIGCHGNVPRGIEKNKEVIYSMHGIYNLLGKN